MSLVVIRLAVAGLFAIALAIVYFDGYDADRTSYESGQLAGMAFRNVVIGVLLGFIVNLLVARRNRTLANWTVVTEPSAYLLGGGVAVALALGFGAPATAEEACATDEPNPVATLSSAVWSESDPQAIPALSGASEEFESLYPRYFFVRGSSGPAFVLTLAVGDSEKQFAELESGFRAASLAEGGTERTEFPPETGATAFLGPGAKTTLFGRSGCFGVFVGADTRDIATDIGPMVLR